MEREGRRWSEAVSDFGPVSEWREGRDDWLAPPPRFAFDARLVAPQPVIVLHNDVTRMLEHTAAGLRPSVLRRGFECSEDLRAAVVAAGPPCGYVFECLGKAILMAAHFAARGALLSGRELADAATRPRGGHRGHQLSALFGALRADHPDCVRELDAVLSEPFTSVAASAVDAFVARLRYLWQDEARGVQRPLGFDLLTMSLQTAFREARGGESSRRTAPGRDVPTGLDDLMYAAALAVLGRRLAGWRRARPLLDRADEHRGALATVALGGLTVAFVGIVFLADRWAGVETGSVLFHPRGLAASLRIVLYSLRVAMGGLAVTFFGALIPPGRARAAATPGLAVAALAMIVALPAVLALVFETVDGAHGSGGP